MCCRFFDGFYGYCAKILGDDELIQRERSANFFIVRTYLCTVINGHINPDTVNWALYALHIHCRLHMGENRVLRQNHELTGFERIDPEILNDLMDSHNTNVVLEASL